MASLKFFSSPSSEIFHLSEAEDSNANLQTTPKLPKRERLASFSRLIAAENFKDLRPEKLEVKKSCKKSSRKLNWGSDCVPDIRISPSSPTTESQDKEGITSKIKDNWNSECLPLPFSPKLRLSPKYESPTYRHPSPLNSPLYVTTRKGGFLGRGSFGNVTLCTYKGTKFALKITHNRASYIGERNFVNIRHPHLVSVLHIASVLDKVFICMEFAGHCNLQQILDTKSELDFPRRLSFTIQTALGLRYCHQRHIVHGDIKPANVIVSPYGICKLGDFGRSIKLDSVIRQLTFQKEDVIGTAAYAAPEVLRGTQPTLSSDVYSFGILLWQVQTREVPFVGEHPHVVIYKVAHGLRPRFQTNFCEDYKNIAKCCWYNEPNQRPSISDVVQKLQDIASSIKKTVIK